MRRALLVASVCLTVLVGCGDEFSGTSEDASVADVSNPDTSVSDQTSPPIDAGSEAAPAPDSSVVDSGCPLVVFHANSEADTQILSNSNLNWGPNGIIGARNDLGGPAYALMRFDVTSLPLTAKIQSIKVDLAWGSEASDCGVMCGSCAAIDKAGTCDLFYMRSDWVESTANWMKRDANNAWGSAGATSSADRSTAPLATFQRALKQSVSVSADPTMLAAFSTWRQTNKISLLVQAEAGALFLIASREGQSLCSATGAPPALTVTYCQ
jgi:hypothetical protein